MKEQWARIEAQLRTLGCLEQACLREGAPPNAIAALESHLGVTLPETFKAFLAVRDGQDRDTRLGIAGLDMLLSADMIREEWDGWREIDEEEMNADSAELMASDPEGFIKPMYTNRLWIPITRDWGGNSIGLDFDPDDLGTQGQVILFGSEIDTKRLVAHDFEDFVERMIDCLSRSRWDGEFLEGTLRGIVGDID